MRDKSAAEGSDVHCSSLILVALFSTNPEI